MDSYIKIPITGITKKEVPPTFTYKLDMDSGRIKGYVDGLEACRQFIRKAIITPRFKCLTYDNQYGSEIKQLITTDDATPGYVASELPRIVTDAIIGDERVISVDKTSFVYAFEEDGLHIKLKVKTIYGDILIQEVINDAV